MALFTQEERKDVVDVLAQAMAVIQRVDWGLPCAGWPLDADLKTPIVITRSGFRAAMACTCFGKRVPRLTDTLLARSEEVTMEEVRPFLFHLISATHPINVWSREGWQADPEARRKLFDYLGVLMRHLVELAKMEQALLAALDGDTHTREPFSTEPPIPRGHPQADRALGNWLLASGLLWMPCGNLLVGAVPAERLPFAWTALQRLALNSQAAETVPAALRRAGEIIAYLYR